jgi:chromosome segregation ATPase
MSISPTLQQAFFSNCAAAVVAWQKVYEIRDRDLAMVQNNVNAAKKNNTQAMEVYRILEGDLSASRLFAKSQRLEYQAAKAIYQSDLQSTKAAAQQVRTLETTNQTGDSRYTEALSQCDIQKKSNEKWSAHLQKWKAKYENCKAFTQELERNVRDAGRVLDHSKVELLSSQMQFSRVQKVFEKMQEKAKEASKRAYQSMEKMYQWQPTSL